MVVSIKKILLTLILITYLFEGAMAEELTTSDRLDIIDVMSSYAKGIDTKDFDFYEKIFSEDVEVNIIGLSSLLKDLISGNLPKEFETPQIRSRLKVVKMQAQKSRYFTRHYKKDSLIPSLKAMYGHYNALISRMIILKQEQSAVISNTLMIP